MPDIEQILLNEQLRWYQLQRHDFLNHWQVIMGYVQMNMGERAIRYMKEGLEGLETEKKLAQIPHDVVAAILLGMVIRLRQERMAVDVSFPEEMKLDTYWQENWRQEYGEALYGYTMECVEEALAACPGDGGKANIIMRSRGTEGQENAAKGSAANRVGAECGFVCEFQLRAGDSIIIKKSITLKPEE